MKRLKRLLLSHTVNIYPQYNVKRTYTSTKNMSMKKWLLRTFSILFQLILMLFLPFWLLIRGSVFLYESYGWHYIPALLVCGGVVFLLLLIYVAMIWDAVFGANKMTRRTVKAKMVFVMCIMMLFTGYTLLNLSNANAKTEDVRKEYHSLHPYLRVAVGTFVLVDNDALITDLSRRTEDYKKMGLKTIKNSLHYQQPTGYVHAMDLRTKDRSEIRNFLLKSYFQLMGFNTLRHMGTADHLHVSLSNRNKPGVI